MVQTQAAPAVDLIDENAAPPVQKLAKPRDLPQELFERRRSRYEQAEHRVDASREPDAIADEVMKLWSA